MSATRPNSTPFCRFAVALAAVAWLCGAQAQVIYKWVDKQGVTQYSTTPPPSGVAGSRIEIAPPPAADAASKPTGRRFVEEAERRAAERAREQAQQQAQQEVQRRSAAERIQLCAHARQQLDTVERGGPVYRYNQGGERIYLEDSARDGEIARLRAEVAANCSAGEAAPEAQDTATRQRTRAAASYAQCNAARDALRDLESGGPRIPAWEIEQARAKAKRLCADAH